MNNTAHINKLYRTNIVIIFKQIIIDLEDPMLQHDKLLDIIKLLHTDLYILYAEEPEIIKGIDRYNKMINELDEIEKIEKINDKLMGYVLYTNKYLCNSKDNDIYIQSKYMLLQALMKATMHQLWQRIYKLFNNNNMTVNTIEVAEKLYTDNVISILKNMPLIV